MTINDLGEKTETVCKSLSLRYPVNLDVMLVMPNHIHFIMEIVGAHHDAPYVMGDAPNNNGDGPVNESVEIRESVSERAIRESPLHRSSMSKIIGYLKMNSSKLIHVTEPNIVVWQRNYYERIIRNEKELNNTRRYIIDNPANWETDIENINA